MGQQTRINVYFSSNIFYLMTSLIELIQERVSLATHTDCDCSLVNPGRDNIARTLANTFAHWILKERLIDCYCVTVVLWYCGTTVALQYCDTVVLKYCGTVVLWYCSTAVL